VLEIDEDAEIALLETEWWVGFCLKKSSCQFFMFRSSDDLEKATIASEDIRRSLLNSVS